VKALPLTVSQAKTVSKTRTAICGIVSKATAIRAIVTRVVVAANASAIVGRAAMSALPTSRTAVSRRLQRRKAKMPDVQNALNGQNARNGLNVRHAASAQTLLQWRKPQVTGKRHPF
jgi:hypothetical protein